MSIRVLFCAVLASAGCGGDESDYETQTNPQYAALVVSQIAGIGGGVTLGSPDAAAGGVLQLGGQAPNIITPVFEEQALRIAPALVPLVGECLCDASGCQFDACSDEAGSFTIDGTIDVSGDSFAFDVSTTQHFESEDLTSDTWMTTSGEITIGASLIDGRMSGSMETEMVFSDEDGDQSIEGWFEWDLRADQIGLDANRCPVSGSLDASVSAEAASGGRDADYSGSGTVVFGPACGDAAVAE